MSRIGKPVFSDVHKVKIIQHGFSSVSTVLLTNTKKQGIGYILPQNPKWQRCHNFFKSNGLLDEEYDAKAKMNIQQTLLHNAR